jgi:Radical SAM superfamily/4Fe-4S single cluster domain
MTLEKIRYQLRRKIKEESIFYSLSRFGYRMIRASFCLYPFFRHLPLITRIFGPRFTRSRTTIEIDITYRCQLGCFNCNQSLGQGQAPSNEEMTVEQIKKFVQESQNNQVKWKRIHVLGGEPTLHPHFLEILSVLLEYKQNYSPDTSIEVVSNGYGERTNEILKKVPNQITVNNTLKKSKEQFFKPFNKAPKDSIFHKYTDYSNGCYVTQKCGTGLTPYGYYPCTVAGGIDRIFGFDKGRKVLPSQEDSMIDLLQTFCQLCGMFKCNTIGSNDTVLSSTWNLAYKEYKQQNRRKTLPPY